MTYLLWAVFLVLQNASFTWVSRARNSGSDWYHASAAVFSNGFWFVSMFITFSIFDSIMESGDWVLGVEVGLLYIAATVTGSVAAGKFLRAYVERGKLRVGAYGVKEGGG